jgi:hypothetical protein
MPSRRTSGAVTDLSCAPRKHKGRLNVNSILTRRERLVAEVLELRHSETSKLTENAQQLLTRWWSAANWNAREELLRSADWLIRVEKKRRGLVQGRENHAADTVEAAQW